MQLNEAIVISPYFPSTESGGSIASKSSLEAYNNCFSKVHFVYVSDLPPNIHGFNQLPADWHHIPLPHHGKGRRFISSALSRLPAVTFKFTQARGRVCAKIKEILRTRGLKAKDVTLLFEDIPIAVLMKPLRDELGLTRCVVRSHNVLSVAFREICDDAYWTRVAWQHEISRISAFEKRIATTADCIWAISQNDANTYQNELQVNVDGVVGVSLDASRYDNINAGSNKTAISIGTIDLRKSHGCRWFLNTVWPLVRKSVPDARLVLAGRNSETFDDRANGIEGLGFVEDDRMVLSRGQVFVNSQVCGSGIKLKSIVALLSAKALVSTAIGVEGIAGESPLHYQTVDTPQNFADAIIELMLNHEQANQLGRQGKAMARQHYTAEALNSHLKLLLSSVGKTSAAA